MTRHALNLRLIDSGGVGAHRCELHSKAVRVRALPFTSMLDNRSLCETSLLLSRCAEAFDWSKVSIRAAVFVRPLEVVGEAPEGLLTKWMQVPHDVFDRIERHFQHSVVDVGARFRSGKAADLIFLAQLTPVS